MKNPKRDRKLQKTTLASLGGVAARPQRCKGKTSISERQQAFQHNTGVQNMGGVKEESVNRATPRISEGEPAKRSKNGKKPLPSYYGSGAN